MGSWSNIILVFDQAMVGYVFEYQDSFYLKNFIKFFIFNFDGELIVFEIQGDSMMLIIINGDFVVCDFIERGEFLWDNYVYVVVMDFVVAKWIQQVCEGDWVISFWLIFDNDYVYKFYMVELEEICQIFKVKCWLIFYVIV